MTRTKLQSVPPRTSEESPRGGIVVADLLDIVRRRWIAHSVGAAAPDLRESAFITDYAAFRGVVADGNLLPRGMPMFDDLSEREIRAVFEYVRKQARLADQ